MAKKTDDLIAAAKKRFQAAMEADDNNRKRALEAIKFSALEQWPDAIKQARERDQEGARPCLVLDKTNQHIRQVVNDQRQNRPAIKVRPVDDQGDEDVAEIFQGLSRHIEDASQADLAYDTAFEQAVDGGYGYWRIITEYEDERSFNQDIRIKRIRNRFSVVLDPSSQMPDGSDAKFGFVYEDIDRDDFKRQYPKADPVDFDTLDKKELGWWATKEKVRVCEYFRIEHVETKLHLLADGTTATDDELKAKGGGAAIQVVKSRDVSLPVVKWSKITAVDELEARDWPGKYIPIVKVTGNEKDVEGELITSGMVTAAMDAQRMYNYAASAFVEMVALAPKAPWTAAEGQIEGHEEEWAKANKSNIAVLQYKPTTVDGVLVPPPMRQPMPGIPTGWAQALQFSEHDIQSATGMYAANLGEQSNEKSGRAIQARQREGDVGSFHYVDNLSRSIRYTGRILVDLIPKIYDTKRIARIIGVDGKPDMVELDPEQEAPVMQKQDQLGRKLAKVYNLGVGKYDVTVTVGPSYSTKRQEAVDWMQQLIQADPRIMQIGGDILFNNMDLPGAEEMAERLKAMLPPQIKQMIEAEDQGQDPKVIALQQQVQQANQMLDQKAQALQQMAAELQQKEQEIAGKDAEASAAIEKLQAQVRMSQSELRAQKLELQVAELNAVNKIQEARNALEDFIESQTGVPVEQGQQMAGAKKSASTVANDAAGPMQSIQSQAALMQVMGMAADAIASLGQEIAKMNTPMDTMLIHDEQGEPIGMRRVPSQQMQPQQPDDGELPGQPEEPPGEQ